MFQSAPTSHNLRDRISNALIRILRLYVALIMIAVMGLIALAAYFYQGAQLDYWREKVLTRVSAAVTNQDSELSGLAASPLLLTERGREAHLAPLLERFNRGPLRKFYILDGRGRAVLPPDSRLAADAKAIASDPIVAAAVNGARRGLGLRVPGPGQAGTQILVVSPFLDPSAESVAGYIVSALDLSLLLAQIGVDPDLKMSLTLGDQTVSPPASSLWMFTSEGATVAAAGDLVVPLRIQVGRDLHTSVGIGVLAMLGVLLLGILMIRRVKAWAVRFAMTITQRLDQLVVQCQNILAGQRLELVEPGPDDELSQVTQALNTMLMQQKKFTDDLHTTSLVFSMAAEGILVTDGEGKIVRANSALLAMTGYLRSELIGQLAGTLYRDESSQEIGRVMAASLQATGRWSGETIFIGRGKRQIPVSVAISRILDDAGDPLGNVAVITDISRLKKIESRLRDLANQDALTGLPNFRYMSEQVQQLLDAAKSDGRQLAILFMDLDNFKAVNDENGHGVGDTLIKAIASHLSHQLPSGHLLCRRSGDEFIAVVERRPGRDPDLSRQLERLFPLLVSTEAGLLSVTATIGISRFPQDADNWQDLQICADVAMAEIKSTKRGHVGWYDAAFGQRLYRRRQIQLRLREAVRSQAFQVHYQPELDLRTGQVIGFEALARWQDPELGEVHPSEFVPVAEEARMMDALTLSIADRVLRDKPLLQAHFAGAVVAFNASPQVFRGSRLLEFLSERNARDDSVLSGLEIELTESEVSRIDPSLQLQIQALVGMGARLVIDDFGTGYSSLSRLTQFPISRIKIDRSFVEGLSRPREMRIARLVIELARTLGFQVTAEGVETVEQMQTLVGMGCYRGQGWLFSPALPASELVAAKQPVHFPSLRDAATPA